MDTQASAPARRMSRPADTGPRGRGLHRSPFRHCILPVHRRHTDARRRQDLVDEQRGCEGVRRSATGMTSPTAGAMGVCIRGTWRKECATLGPGWRLATDAEWTRAGAAYGGTRGDDGRLGAEAYEALLKAGARASMPFSAAADPARVSTRVATRTASTGRPRNAARARPCSSTSARAPRPLPPERRREGEGLRRQVRQGLSVGYGSSALGP